MNAKNFLFSGALAGIVIFIIIMVVNYLMQIVFSGYDVNALPGMRALDDPILMMFFLYPLVLGFAMAFVYQKVKEALPGSYMDKAKKYALLAWLLSGLPSIWVVYTSMNYPIAFTVDQIVGSIIYTFAAAVVIAKLS